MTAFSQNSTPAMNTNSETSKKPLHYECNMSSDLHKRGCDLIEQGNLESAMKVLRKALQIRSSIYGEEHINIATTLYNIGRIYHDREEYSFALTIYQKALQMQRNTLSTKDHVSIISTMVNIGRVHHLGGNLKEALQTYLDLIRIVINKVGSNHPFIPNILKSIGNIRLEMGDTKRGIEYLTRASLIENMNGGDSKENKDEALMSTSIMLSRCSLRSPNAAAA